MSAFVALCVSAVYNPLLPSFAIHAFSLVAIGAPVQCVIVVVSAPAHPALCCGVRRGRCGILCEIPLFCFNVSCASALWCVYLFASDAYAIFAVCALDELFHAGLAAPKPAFPALSSVSR